MLQNLRVMGWLLALITATSAVAAQDAATTAPATREATAGAATPIEALTAYTRAVQTGDVEAAVAMVDPQREQARELVSGSGPLIVASAELTRAVEERFGVRIASLFAPAAPAADDVAGLTKATPNDDDNERVMLATRMRDGVFEPTITTNATIEVHAVRRNGRWYVDPSNGFDLPPEAVEAGTAIAASLAESVAGLAAEVRAGEHADLMDVESVLNAAYAAAMEPAMDE